MKVKLPWAGDGLETTKGLSFKSVIRLAIYLLIVIAVIYLGWRIYNHFTEKNNATHGITSLSKYDKATSTSSNASLQAKDYTSYIGEHITLAADYQNANDNKNAERVMNEVFANVPADKLNSSAYGRMVSIEQALGNTDKYKQYLSLYIKQLNKDGDSQGAATAQTILDQTK